MVILLLLLLLPSLFVILIHCSTLILYIITPIITTSFTIVHGAELQKDKYLISSVYNLNDSLVFTVDHTESIFFVRPPPDIFKSIILLNDRLRASLLRTPCQVNRTSIAPMCHTKLLSLSPCATVFNVSLVFVFYLVSLV